MLSYLKVLLVLATRLKSSNAGACGPAAFNPQHPVLVELRDLIEENYRTLHSPAEYATLLYVTPKTLGRIVRDAQGAFLGIVEDKDATPDQRRITEVNLSCYVFNARDLWFALDRIRDNNVQGEFYLTDCPGVLKAAGKDVRALPVLAPSEALSINTREELAQVEAALIAAR